MSKERSDLIEKSLHSTYEECLLYLSKLQNRLKNSFHAGLDQWCYKLKQSYLSFRSLWFHLVHRYILHFNGYVMHRIIASHSLGKYSGSSFCFGLKDAISIAFSSNWLLVWVGTNLFLFSICIKFMICHELTKRENAALKHAVLTGSSKHKTCRAYLETHIVSCLQVFKNAVYCSYMKTAPPFNICLLLQNCHAGYVTRFNVLQAAKAEKLLSSK